LQTFEFVLQSTGAPAVQTPDVQLVAAVKVVPEHALVVLAQSAADPQPCPAGQSLFIAVH
jgi:hypothetical protein